MGKRRTVLFAGKTMASFALSVALGTTPPKQGEPQPNPKWIHIANEGQFDGYPGGGVQITRSTFEQIVRNFKADPRYHVGEKGLGDAKVIPFDFGHVSEMDPRIGDPAQNEKAPAWVMDVQIREGEHGRAQLWGWTLLGDDVKAMIEKGEITFVSIAYQPHAIHPVDGAEIGALMTSVAFTNKPFIRDLTPLAASDFAAHAAGYMRAHPEAASLLINALSGGTTQEPKPMALDVKVVCKVLGLNPSSATIEDDLEGVAREFVVLKRGLADVLKATGFSDLADLIQNIPGLLKAKTELEGLGTKLSEALKQLAGYEEQVDAAEVSAAMSAHKIPEVSRAAMAVFLKTDRTGFRAKYPIPDEQRKHLLTTFAAGSGGAQFAPQPLTGENAGGGNGTAGTGGSSGGEKIDLRSFTGRNISEKIVAYLGSKDPKFEKLPAQEQFKRAATFRQQNAAHIVGA